MIILGIDIPASAIAPLALVIAVAAFSCTGLGLINAALSLRIRENAVLSNVIFGFLLIFTGANVPLSELPDWAQTIVGRRCPSHTRSKPRASSPTERRSATSPASSGPSCSSASCTPSIGYALLRYMEVQSRRHATLERS